MNCDLKEGKDPDMKHLLISEVLANAKGPVWGKDLIHVRANAWQSA